MGKPTDIGSPIKTFVEDSIKQITNALPNGFRIKEDINFELSVANVGEAGGGLDLRVLKLGGKVNQENIQKINFSVTNKEEDPMKKAEENLLKKKGLI